MKDGIFFAYAHSDRDRALPIKTMFRQAEFVVADFADPLAVSVSLEANLKALLDASKLLVMLWSHNGARSRWLEMEWRYFLRSPEASILLLRIDDAPLPPDLMPFQARRLPSEGASFLSEMALILRSLEGHVLKIDRQKVFVSYSRQDADVVNRRVAELSACRVRPYMDTEFVEDDDTFAEDIIAALRDSAALCFMSTKRSNLSRHCAREVSLADKFGKPLALVQLDASGLSDSNVYFFANVSPRSEGESLCDYLCREIDRQAPRALAG